MGVGAVGATSGRMFILITQRILLRPHHLHLDLRLLFVYVVEG